jgi:hypothetical protein
MLKLSQSKQAGQLKIKYKAERWSAHVFNVFRVIWYVYKSCLQYLETIVWKVIDEPAYSFLSVEVTLLLTCRWRYQRPPKRWYPSIFLHIVTFQTIVVLIFTDAKISNLTSDKRSSWHGVSTALCKCATANLQAENRDIPSMEWNFWNVRFRFVVSCFHRSCCLCYPHHASPF